MPAVSAAADTGLGNDALALADANRRAIGVPRELREHHETPATRIVISANLRPRRAGYHPDTRISAKEAHLYHSAQIECFADTDADMVCALAMNDVEGETSVAGDDVTN